jgi:hypothetical protein
LVHHKGHFRLCPHGKEPKEVKDPLVDLIFTQKLREISNLRNTLEIKRNHRITPSTASIRYEPAPKGKKIDVYK